MAMRGLCPGPYYTRNLCGAAVVAAEVLLETMHIAVDVMGVCARTMEHERAECNTRIILKYPARACPTVEDDLCYGGSTY